MNTKSNARMAAVPGKLPGVLVIEDAMHGELISSLLLHSGFSVWHASDEEDAMLAARCFTPDVMLVALNDNGTDGPVIVAKLKAENPHLKNVPVILMSERSLSQMARRGMATLNITWILEKPLVLTSLPKLILATIGSSRRNLVRSSRYIRQIEFGQTASSALMDCVV